MNKINYKSDIEKMADILVCQIDREIYDPLISIGRRIYSTLVNKNSVQVQPMSAPSGLIFYLDFHYKDKNLNEENPTE